MDKSTISREFRRNKGKRGWRPSQAQSLRDERRNACNNDKHFSLSEWAEVDRLIRKDLTIWFTHYNEKRKHTSLDKRTPDEAYYQGLEQLKLAA